MITLTTVFQAILFDEPQGISRAWLPILFSIVLVFILASSVFAFWQWERLPGKWWVLVIDTTVSGMILWMIWHFNYLL